MSGLEPHACHAGCLRDQTASPALKALLLNARPPPRACASSRASSPRGAEPTGWRALDVSSAPREGALCRRTHVSRVCVKIPKNEQTRTKPMDPGEAGDTPIAQPPALQAARVCPVRQWTGWGGAGRGRQPLPRAGPTAAFAAGPLGNTQVSVWPSVAATSGDPRRTQNRPTRWPPLCPLGRSSTPQRCHRCPGSCAPGSRSECSRCVHTCQRSHWPGTCRRG